MRITILPKTSLARWSVWLAVAWILFFVLFMVAAESGFAKDSGLGRVLDTYILGSKCQVIDIAGLIPTTGMSAASFVTGLISMIKSKERSILVFLVMIVGLLILFSAARQVLAWCQGRA